ncbi:MAG TPA: amidohydrolase family protein [Candidatus Dormibacteraeota bacterium]|nr:amidohydrolase family protein [Candidatus Dormibacteraeota bacterium]
MTRIDLHCHVFPANYRNQLPPNVKPPPPEAELLAYMDVWGIDAAVLSSGGPLVGERPAPELSRLINEGYAELVRTHPSRFGALACMPLPNVDAALTELEHALDTLGLNGVLLLSNYQGIYLGDPRLDPFFEELERRGAYCFVHPDFPPTWPLAGHPGRWYEFPFDTTRALVNLALSGTLDRCPSVRLQWAHLGGTVPFIANRIHNQAAVMPDRTARMSAGMREYFARQYYDTAQADSYGNLIAALGIAPIEHIVFGTDWPYVHVPEHGSDPQPALGIFGLARPRVDGANARALVPRLCERVDRAERVRRAPRK